MTVVVAGVAVAPQRLVALHCSAGVAWSLLPAVAPMNLSSPTRSPQTQPQTYARAQPLPFGEASAGRYGFSPDTQLNWLARYLPIKEYLSDVALDSLLEVGSGARGLSCILQDAEGRAATRFVGIDTRFAGPPAPSMIPFAYEGGRLPFRDGAFHTVVSMDTLEHVPPAQRRGFIDELARVSSARVIAGFPAVSEPGGDGLHGERFLQGLLRALGMGDPEWLHEHEALGLPRATEVEEILDTIEGRSWRRLPTTGSLVNLMAVLIDLLPGTRPWLAPLLAAHGPALEAWFRAGMFGPTDRAVYLIERRQTAAPLVSLAAITVAGASSPVGPPAALVRALACPDCDAVLEDATTTTPDTAPSSPSASAPALACRGCLRIFSRDAQGVIGLARSAGPVTFRLAPDWLSGADWVVPVHNYLQTFAAGDSCVLWLDVDPAQLSATEALQMMQPVLARFGERPFAEIFLNDQPASKPRRGRVVPLPAGRNALYSCTSEWFRTHVQAAHAQTTGGAGGDHGR